MSMREMAVCTVLGLAVVASFPALAIGSLWGFILKGTLHEPPPGKGELVKSILVAITPIGIAGIGGAFAVFGSYDDSPGGTLLGILLLLGAMAYGAKSAWRKDLDNP